ncbi:hypothetical protein E2C01_035370 [Portunus trituberculatus]|uniref:Uncharacterized protein n=1 Tax=Portunus trituberculatus TaxID=210409 RepID=A0A5B7F8A3_PORTR|nr:hypothetical protein [Portunus trituberculatus]
MKGVVSGRVEECVVVGAGVAEGGGRGQEEEEGRKWKVWEDKYALQTSPDPRNLHNLNYKTTFLIHLYHLREAPVPPPPNNPYS